jgi:hypothetical protein
MLAAGQVKLVAIGNALVKLVEDGVMVTGSRVGATGESIEVNGGVVVGSDPELITSVILGLALDTVVVVWAAAIEVLKMSGQEAPGLHGSIEQQPLKPF